MFRHIRKMIVAGLIYSAAGFWVCDRLLMAWARHDYGPMEAYDLRLPSTRCRC